jgi:hypothetical protein
MLRCAWHDPFCAHYWPKSIKLPALLFYLPLPERKRNKPRVSSGLPCVRARFEAVETPLNRMKKSKKARQKPFLLPVTILGKPLKCALLAPGKPHLI